jgi:adenylate cyclase
MRRWWARRRLRAKIFLPFSALVLAVLLSTLWLVTGAVSRQVEGDLRRRLIITGDVFRGRVAERAQRLLATMQLVADDFALKRAIATYDPDTLESVATNYRRRAGTDALWITNESGRVLAGRGSDGAAASTLASIRPLSDTLRTAAAGMAISELEGELYELVAVAVVAPRDPIGFLVAGERIDSRTAAQLQRETGSEVSFVTGERVFASSWPEEKQLVLFPGGRPASLFPSVARPTFLARLGDERLLSILVPVDAALDQPLYALVQQSYDTALAPLHALRRRIVLIGAVALFGALIVGAALAGGIASPLRVLVAAMRDVLAGNYQRRLEIGREDEIGFLADSFNEMVSGLEERERIKDTFGRFVSRDIANVLLDGRVSLEGERREVTILFQDTRGFTAIADRTDPGALVRMVNRLFTAMVAAVESEGGVIKEFTGDGVMALFGAPVVHDDDPDRAVRAALAMLARLPALNAELCGEGLAEVRIGIGVHCGEVVAGRIGPDERAEYTVIGDPVNVASRIEGLTKETGATLLVSAAAVSRLAGSYRFGRRFVVPIRGKEEPVEVIEVLVGRGEGRLTPDT